MNQPQPQTAPRRTGRKVRLALGATINMLGAAILVSQLLQFN